LQLSFSTLLLLVVARTIITVAFAHELVIRFPKKRFMAPVKGWFRLGGCLHGVAQMAAIGGHRRFLSIASSGQKPGMKEYDGRNSRNYGLRFFLYQNLSLREFVHSDCGVEKTARKICVGPKQSTGASVLVRRERERARSPLTGLVIWGPVWTLVGKADC
jgi:hypothetical protein